MKNLFAEHKTLAGTVLLLFVFSLLCQIAAGFLYQNMIKETYNMSSTKNKMLKKCKLKFANRCEMHEKVANIPIFVDKFIHSIKFGPFSVRWLQHFSGQILMFSVFLTGVGACRAIIARETIGDFLAYYVIVFVMLYAYFAVSAAADLKGKREILKTNLIDYLENSMSARIPESKREQERLDALEASAEKQDVRPEVFVQAKGKSAEITDFAAHKKKGEEGKQAGLAPEEREELQGLLQEFVYLSY